MHDFRLVQQPAGPVQEILDRHAGYVAIPARPLDRPGKADIDRHPAAVCRVQHHPVSPLERGVCRLLAGHSGGDIERDQPRAAVRLEAGDLTSTENGLAQGALGPGEGEEVLDAHAIGPLVVAGTVDLPLQPDGVAVVFDNAKDSNHVASLHRQVGLRRR